MHGVSRSAERCDDRAAQLGLLVHDEVGQPLHRQRDQVGRATLGRGREVREPGVLAAAAGVVVGQPDRPGVQAAALEMVGEVGTGGERDGVAGVARGQRQRQQGVDVAVQRAADEQDAHGNRTDGKGRSLAPRAACVLDVCDTLP